jgi:hypothetical protein
MIKMVDTKLIGTFEQRLAEINGNSKPTVLYQWEGFTEIRLFQGESNRLRPEEEQQQLFEIVTELFGSPEKFATYRDSLGEGNKARLNDIYYGGMAGEIVKAYCYPSEVLSVINSGALNGIDLAAAIFHIRPTGEKDTPKAIEQLKEQNPDLPIILTGAPIDVSLYNKHADAELYLGEFGEKRLKSYQQIYDTFQRLTRGD